MPIKDHIVQAGEELATKLKFEAGVPVNETEVAEAALAQVGLTQDGLNDTDIKRGSACAALGYAVGKQGFEAFKADPKLDKVNASFKLGQDEFNVQFSRSSTSYNPSNGETVTNHMTSQLSYVAGAGRNLGQLKQVREHFKGLGKAEFGEK